MSVRRRVLVPEIVQTSVMDCGPAALAALLGGLGRPISYGRLREACQTDVDGTSIDVIEEVAVQLGCRASQEIVPLDHLFLPESAPLPAILVVRRPGGDNHFVVVWRRHGGRVQIMDPAIGRRFITLAELKREAYVHTATVPIAETLDWLRSADFTRPLARCMRTLGMEDPEAMIQRADADGGGHAIAALDASVRMAAQLTTAGAVRRGSEVTALVGSLWPEAMRGKPSDSSIVPTAYWAVILDESAERATLQGAVLVSVSGLATDAKPTEELSPELRAALAEPRPSPLRALAGLVRGEGGRLLWLLALGVATAACIPVVEALLLRASVEVGRDLTLVPQRVAGLIALLAWFAGALVVDYSLMTGLRNLGRRLEVRLRTSFLSKIPRLGDRYLASRPISDMAERAHSMHAIRRIAEVGGALALAVAGLIATTAALAWLDPPGAFHVVAAAIAVVIVPLVGHVFLRERDLRLRSHVGALGVHNLDALMGLAAVRAHGAERALRHRHEELLGEWARTGRSLVVTATNVQLIGTLVAFGAAAALVWSYLSRSPGTDGVILYLYWALALPAFGQTIAGQMQQVPGLRSVILRLLEPLGAPEDDVGDEVVPAAPRSAPRGVHLRAAELRVVAGGHPVLDGLDVEIEPGEHVAIVGRSGAGKSSLLGALLGWHRPASGALEVDGRPLDATALAELRAATAWVDPAVQLWNRSLVDNLRYGNRGEAALPFDRALRDADLLGLVARLPDGMSTVLGEGGGLVSGGEGQRVRLGRAFLREGVRLALLDEPFRGLDRSARARLLATARARWSRATLLCVTHDVRETAEFPRVLVIEDGRVVEDGAPALLAAQPTSRYRALLAAEDRLAETWTDPSWIRLHLDASGLGAAPRTRQDEEAAA